MLCTGVLATGVASVSVWRAPRDLANPELGGRMCRKMCGAAIAERVGGTAASSRGGEYRR